MTTWTMEQQQQQQQPSLPSPRGGEEEPDNLSLREWALKANISSSSSSRESRKSRRYSASNITSFREDVKSLRTISSTVSSPGYSRSMPTDEINPSTYSFTTAIKALQARSGGYGWEWLSPDAVALNSKWNEAEKYICNPLSGEFPMECLSAKTLSGRSFATSKTKTTISAPLAYSFRQPNIQTPPPSEEKVEKFLTRDVGTQSTPPDGSPSPASTPNSETCELPKACSNSKFTVQIEITREMENLKEEEHRKEKDQVQVQVQVVKKCRQGNCFPSRFWMRKKQREKQKSLWKVLVWMKKVKL